MRSLYFGLVLTWGALLGLSAQGADRVELELVRIMFAHSTHEISGGAIVDGALLIVSDDKKHHYLYRVEESGKRFALKPVVDLEKLAGWKEFKAFYKASNLPKKAQRLDLEGMAVCGQDFYLADERARRIARIRAGKIESLPIAFDGDKELFEGGPNAGFEGVAADCERGILYVAKEREPRRLYEIDMKTWKILRAVDFEGSDRQGQKVVNPFTGKGLLPIHPDIADLVFDNGYLYALERNTWEIAKLDPKTLEPVARVSYYFAEAGLYETGEPFGIAELLVFKGDEIWVGLDNNGSPLGVKAVSKYDVSGEHGAILVFKRPAGF